MAPTFNTAGLSPLHQRVLAHGVSGGDENDPAAPDPAAPPADPAAPPAQPAPTDPPADPAAPPADPAPAAAPTADPAAPAAPADPAQPPADSIQLPVVPEGDALGAADETALRTLYDELEAVVQANVQTAPADQLPVLEQARAQQDAIRAEIVRRQQVAADVTRRLEAIATPSEALPEPLPVPALASAAAVTAGRDPQPAAHAEAPAARAPRPRAALVAAAGSNVVSPGSEIDLGTLGEAIDAVKDGDAGKARLASIQGYDEMGEVGLPASLSTDNTWMTNNELIREAQADFTARQRGETPAARTAAICEPLDIIREIPDAFSATEVVSPELPSRPAGRLGFQHTRSISLADVLSGVAHWTEADQALVDEEDRTTWKPCVDVECENPVSVKAEAVTACLGFDITTEMSNPEIVRNYMNALDAVRARTKEGRILERLDILSGRYTFTGTYGALPTLIEVISEFVARATFAQRQDDPGYTLFINPLTVALLRIDRANRAFGANCDTCDVLGQLEAEIEGVSRVVQTLDAASNIDAVGAEPGLPPGALNAPGAGAVALTPSTGTHRIRLIEPRSFIYAESGKRDTGVQRSPELNRMNKAQLFGEEFFFLDRTGPWANASIDVALCDDGARAGFLEPAGCGS